MFTFRIGQEKTGIQRFKAKYLVLLVILFLPFLLEAQPVGANINNPVIIGNYSQGSYTFTDTKNNTTSNGYLNDIGNASDDIYYRITVQGTTTLNISLCGATFDTYLHLLNSTGVGIATNDDNGPLCSGLQSSIQTTVAPGTYYIVTEGYGTNAGSLPISVNSVVQAPPLPPDTRNFIRVWDATAPETNPNTLMTRATTDVKQSTQYFDGLGRPEQTVIKKGSLTGGVYGDLVSPVLYDSYGREAQKYLPYVATTIDGLFKANPLTDQNTFYSGASSPIAGQAETFFYGQTVFEASPLNRVLETAAPGNSWAGSMGGVTEDSRRSVKMKYYINTIIDGVRIWNVTTGTIGSFGTYTSTGVYPAGSLYKNISIDEKGSQVIEFKDKEGKVILKKVQLLPSSADVGGLGKNHAGWLCTYYLYDDLNNLRCVIQPRGIELINIDSWSTPYNLTDATILAEQCFRYEYDSRNRMIMKKVPGAGEVYMIYDKKDRLAMTQDANLRLLNKWMVTLYDGLNRPVQTGLLLNTWDGLNKTFTARLTDGAANTTDYPFASTATPTVSFWEYLTKTGYDDYSTIPAASGLTSAIDPTYNTYLTGSAASPDYAVAMPAAASLLTKGMVTWTETKVLNPSSYTYGVMLYDDKGRVIQVKSKNFTNGTDINTTQYTWAGQPLISVQKQQNAFGTGQTSVVVSKFTYDDLGRVTKTEKRIQNTLVNGNAMSAYTTVSALEYDALGQLKKKKLGNKPGASAGTALNSLDYEYNIRGWLLSLNKSYITATSNSDQYFGMQLGYDKDGALGTFSNKQFNGNIGGTIWKSEGDQQKRKYDFTYDPVNRLLKADFNQYVSGIGNTALLNKSAGVDFSMQMGDGINGATAYDANGNIKAMKQWGLKLNTSPVIDDLIYTYETNSNRLKNVWDAANEATSKMGDFKTSILHPQNTTKTAATNQVLRDAITDYAYDVNGNLTKDYNKDIGNATTVGIQYNHLNLPISITVKKDITNNKGTISYSYDATGNKLQKQTVDIGTAGKTITTTTTYLSGFVYESKTTLPANTPNDDYANKLQFTGHEEGRIRALYDNSAQPNTLTGFAYDYMIKDHLGNVRMVLTEEVKPAIYPFATMETANTINENIIFSNINSTRQPKPSYLNDPVYGSGTQAAKVKNIVGSQKTGPGIILKVMAGDSYNLRVVSGWTSGATPTSGSSSNVLAELLSSLSTGMAGQSSGKATAADLQLPGSGLSNAISSFLSTQPVVSGKPKAYINWVLFDEQFKIDLPNSSFEQVGAANSTTVHTRTNLPVRKNGYLYIYVSNESDNIDVFFDNLAVTHNRGPILEETHYYPFGLTMGGISSKAAGILENKKRYNGIELDNDLDINTYEAELRDLDPALGRWWQIDPKTDNQEMWSPYTSNNDNPILYKDPRGDEGEACCGGFWDAIKKTAGEAKALVLGAANAWGSDQVLGAGNKTAEEAGFTGDEATFYDAGQTTGHGAAIITGTAEFVVGGGSEVLTVGGSTPVSVPLALHGASSISTALSKLLFAEHKKNARPSTEQQHQEGQTRQQQDRQGSKGMTEPPRRKPPNHRGPWPPKPTPPKPTPPKPVEPAPKPVEPPQAPQKT